MASFSPEDVFLLPVVIDETAIDDEALPAEFKVRQATKLPDGNPTPEFIERIKQLYRKRQLARSGGA